MADAPYVVPVIGLHICSCCCYLCNLLCCVLCRKNGYELSYNQEIVGLGIANFAGAMFNSYTTTGSFSRSAVNNSSGGCALGDPRSLQLPVAWNLCLLGHYKSPVSVTGAHVRPCAHI